MAQRLKTGQNWGKMSLRTKVAAFSKKMLSHAWLKILLKEIQQNIVLREFTNLGKFIGTAAVY